MKFMSQTVMLSVLTLSAIVGCGATTQREESTDLLNIPGQFVSPGALTANGEQDAPVGGCLNLGGSVVDAKPVLVNCSSVAHAYKIVRRVNQPQECGDTDHSYFFNSKATGPFAVCLDLAWDASSCLSLGQPVKKVSCDDPQAPKKYKPLKVIVDTMGLDGCTSGGYTHPQRRFTVCTQPET